MKNIKVLDQDKPYCSLVFDLGKGKTGQMSIRHAKIIAQRLKDGKRYYVASLVYEMKRQEIALIHINMEEILKL